MLSDIETMSDGCCFEEFDENRPDSPDTLIFHLKDQEIDVSSVNLVIPIKPLKYADICRCT